MLGCSDLTIATDNKPLLKIFGDRSLDQIGNTRLRNLKEKTLPYRFRMIHIPGLKNQTPDALSRYPTGTPTPERLVLQDDVHAVLDQAPTRWPQPPTSLLSGISLIDSLDDSEDMETILQDSLVLAMTSTHPISWEQVQTATAEDADMLLLTPSLLPEPTAHCATAWHLLRLPCPRSLRLLPNIHSNAYVQTSSQPQACTTSS